MIRESYLKYLQFKDSWKTRLSQKRIEGKKTDATCFLGVNKINNNIDKSYNMNSNIKI